MRRLFFFGRFVGLARRAGLLTARSSLAAPSLAFALALLTCAGQAQAALDVSMNITPTYANPINPGDVTAFRITLTNSNPLSDVTGVGFTDTMPPQIMVAGVGVKSITCVDGSGVTSTLPLSLVTAPLGGNTISFAGGTVPIALSGGSSGKCDIDVEVTSLVRNNAFVNTIPAHAVTGNDNTGAVDNSSAAQQSITVNDIALPTISKNFSAASVVRGKTVRLSMTIANGSATVNLPLNGAADTPAYALRDALPAGLQVAATPNASANCTGAGTAPAFAPAAGATTLIATGGTVAGGGTCTLAVDVVGTSTNGAYSNTVQNRIDRSADFGNKRGLTPGGDATANVDINSVLRVFKRFVLGTVSAGQQSTMEITLDNDGLAPVTLTSLPDSLIDGIGNAAYGLKITGAPTNTCGGTIAVNGGATGFTMTGGTIAAGGNCVISVPFTGSLQTPGQPQTFTNTIAQGAITATDNTIVSQQAAANVTVVDQLLINKDVNPTNVAPGNPIQYSVRISNYSTQVLNNVVLLDPLPAGVFALPTLPSPPALTGAGCTGLSSNIPALPASQSNPQFTIATMPAGTGADAAVCTVTFWAMAPKGSGINVTLNNTIPANNAGTGGIKNTAASNAAVSTTNAGVAINKNFNPATAGEGTVSLLTLTLTNVTAQPITNAGFTDNLPGSAGQQIVIANPASASTTCVGATLTATPGSSSITMSGATIPARGASGTGTAGSCQVQVKVIGPAGSYLNTVPAGALTGTQTYADGVTAAISSLDPASASLTYTSALSSSKTFTPATIRSGGRSTVRINLSNVDTGTLNNVSATDTFPTGMVMATPSNAYNTCGGAPVITAVPGAASASISGVVLQARGSCDFLFDIVATGGANWTNTLAVGDVTATGGVRNVLPVTATLNNTSAGSVTVTNNITPNNLPAPGATSVLTVTINNGPLAVSNLNLPNYFSVDGSPGGALTGLRLAAAPNLATNCPGGIVTGAAGGTTVTLSNASIAASGVCTVTANVTLNTSGTVQDTIPVGAVTTSQGISNTTATVTSLAAGGNIGVIKSFNPAVTKPGDRTRLRLTFINPGAIALSNLSAVDNFPGGITVPASANPSTTCTGAVVTAPTPATLSITGGTLAAAATGTSTTCDVEIDVIAGTAGSFVNTIQVGDFTGVVGGSPVSNPVASSATLEVRQPVTIAKTFTPASVRPGLPSAVTITLGNGNNVALTGAVLSDVLPANVVVAQTPNASATNCGAALVSAPISATSVALTGATLPASGGAVCTLKFDVVSNISGVYVNTIPAGALTTAQGVTNIAPVSATLSLLDPPTVNKQFSPVAIAANDKSTLTIVLGNTNPSAVTLSSALVDTLPVSPGNLVVATPNNLNGTCTMSSVTAVSGSGSVTYANGASIPPGGCTINVDVTGAVLGSYNNFIPAGALTTGIGNSVQPATANLDITPLGSITGKVFKDNNVVPNGSFELGADIALASIQVTLTGTSYGANGVAGGGDDAVIAPVTTSTDALGNYAFSGLLAGSYTVTETTQPAGTTNGITTSGTLTNAGFGTPGVATGIATTPSRIANIVLLRDGSGKVTSSNGNNFAEVAPSSISGKVFLDQDNNGVQDIADTAIAGVAVELLNNLNAVVATTATDATGAYSFTNLAPGTYSVREPTQPSGTVGGRTIAGAVGNSGTPGTPTAVTVAPSVIASIVLPPGTNSSGNNFAEVPSGRQVSGRVFGDANNDGLFNGTDVGLANVTLTLTGTDINGVAVAPRSVVSGVDGRYTFTGLAEGTYIVSEPTQPARSTNGITTAGSTGGTATATAVTPSAISAINLTGANTISVNNNFGEILVLIGAVSGKVYVDANNNGIIDAGETGIAGVPVVLNGIDVNGATVNLPVVTAADGSYSFPNLQPSNAAGYTITETQPSLYKDGRTTIASGNPGIASSGKPVLSSNIDVIRKVVVVAGDVLPNYNFGELSAATVMQPIINGYVYLDRDHSRNRPVDGSAAGQSGWTVQLSQAGVPICTVSTDANGFYQFDNLHCPGYETSGLPTGANFAITFNKDGSRLPAVPTSGGNRGLIPATGGMITNITIAAIDQVIEQNLPLDPSGVIYDSMTRVPVAGAVISISGPAGFDPGVHLVGGAALQSQTVGSDGFYQFLLQNAFPSGVYALTVTAPPGYLSPPSTSIPACTGAAVIGAIPNPAAVQASNSAPGLLVPLANPGACVGIVAGGAPTTQYYFSFNITNGVSAPILNNHIPLDPGNSSTILVTKTTPLVNVARGDLVPYTVTATNMLSGAVANVDIRDQIPPGFKYRLGSATLNGAVAEPVVNGRLLTWPKQNFAPKEKKIYRLILTVGSGVGEGNYTNQAWALNNPGNQMLSQVATATVRIVPDPTFDCPDIIGKVFDDRNANGYQDQGEPGIPAVRVVTPRGLLVTTDAEGRFHVPCPDIPNEDRGANFVMKLDERSLPTGYRVTTENPRDVRLTRGKVTRLNFGATIHRVIRLELSDSAFLPGQTVLQPQWQKQFDALPAQLRLKPSVVRLVYQPGNDDAMLVSNRMDAIRRQLRKRWESLKAEYTLNIETEGEQ